MPHAQEQLWLICYDISDDRKRYRVERALQAFGVRVQFSVWGCQLDRRALARLKSRLGQLIDKRHDSVRLYPVCRFCWQSNRQRQVPLPPPTPDHWML